MTPAAVMVERGRPAPVSGSRTGRLVSSRDEPEGRRHESGHLDLTAVRPRPPAPRWRAGRRGRLISRARPARRLRRLDAVLADGEGLRAGG